MNSSFSSSSSSNDSDYMQESKKIKKDDGYQKKLTEDYYTDINFKIRFRFSKTSINYLESLVEHDLRQVNSRGLSLTVKQKIMIALRYYATGCFQIVSDELIGISHSTIRLTVQDVSKAFARLSKQFIKMPTTAAERQIIQQKFHSIQKIPRCVGCIDSCHIPINSPRGENAELFRNRKGYFSINVQAVVDADCKFEDLVARYVQQIYPVNLP